MPVHTDESAVTDEGCGFPSEGKEMFRLAFVAAVEPAAASKPGHGPLDTPSVAAEPLRGREAVPFVGGVVVEVTSVGVRPASTQPPPHRALGPRAALCGGLGRPGWPEASQPITRTS